MWQKFVISILLFPAFILQVIVRETHSFKLLSFLGFQIDFSCSTEVRDASGEETVESFTQAELNRS